jgi:D-glycero-D-manno-heptose 1,7-bisphosphate phosphatase
MPFAAIATVRTDFREFCVKAAFLDRDGVINRDLGYIHKVQDFQFMPGIFEACDGLQSAGYRLFVVTNQAGIAKGLYTQAQMDGLHAWMVEQFGLRGIRFEKVYHCPHHPAGIVEPYAGTCECRKPKPGMLFAAREEFGVDLAQSLLVGNAESDIEAALAAGLPTTVLIDEEPVPRTTKAGVVIRTMGELPERLKRAGVFPS